LTFLPVRSLRQAGHCHGLRKVASQTVWPLAST